MADTWFPVHMWWSASDVMSVTLTFTVKVPNASSHSVQTAADRNLLKRKVLQYKKSKNRERFPTTIYLYTCITHGKIIYSLYWFWGFFIACVHIHFHNLFNSYNFKLKSSFAIYIQIFLLHWADFLELHIYINIS